MKRQVRRPPTISPDASQVPDHTTPMEKPENTAVRVRFAPSPTGYLHIGGARTLLFNWLLARRAGGTLVLRIEDTDRTRHVEDSVQKILDDLRWLGLDWDEGPEKDGRFGPYFQSQRLKLYDQHIDRLLASGQAYFALETPEELQAMREKARSEKRVLNYQRPDPLPTIREGEAAKREGRPAVVRFKMPAEDITVHDDILGDVTLSSGQIEDFVIQKSDGFPTYHFACVVDDELMRITHVLRGQEHLMNTPKHIAMQRAMGFSTPRYAHMPVIFNMNGSKMSKRDKEKALKKGETPPEIEVHDFRIAGYLPEAVVNFIALLGWNPGDEREFFSLDELVKTFSLQRVGKTNAKFDRQKLLAFNTHWAGSLEPDRLFTAFRDYLRVAPDVADAMRSADETRLRYALESCAGFHIFPDVVKKSGFAFQTNNDIRYEEKAVAKVLAKNDGAGFSMLEFMLVKLESLDTWSVASIEELIRSVCEKQKTKMGQVAQPLRVAVSGSTISPAIGDSLALLGRENTLARIRQCLSLSPKHEAP